MKDKQQLINNQKGSLTLDFILASIVVALGMGAFMSLSLTLSHIEVAQFMTYATARTYLNGDESPEKQTERAEIKFNQLLNQNQTFKTMFRDSGWFNLKYIETGDFTESYPSNFGKGNVTFYGTQVEFIAQVLDLNFKFLGATDGPWSSKVQTFLGREPTVQECLIFEFERRQKLIELHNNYGLAAFDTNLAPIVTGNGC